MQKRINLTAVLIAAVLLATTIPAIANGQNRLITSKSVGDIRIGSTIGDVRKILKGATFSRDAGEGHDVIDVKENGKSIMWLSVETKDQNQESPVTNDEKIFAIEVVDPRFRTAEGVGVETMLKDAAGKYGRLKHLWIEGLTGDEVATFWNHPKGIDFKVSKNSGNTDPDDKAGIYVGNNNRTAVFTGGTIISSISIPGSYGTGFLDEEIKLVTATNAGDVRIGMTVAEARAALGKTMVADFKRSGDGEGLALISVSLIGTELMTLYAGEDDPKNPIDESAKIEFIEVWSPEFQTKEGLTPKMKLKDAEQIYGRVKRISISEIESRETIEFERQPKGLTFRVTGKDSGAGIYGDGRMQTDSFDPGAMIFSIQLSRIPNTVETSPDVSGAKTFLLKNASPNFDVKIGIGGCDNETCEGPALVQLFRKGEAAPFQTVSMKNMYLELGDDQEPTANLIELYGTNNSGFVFDDFDFDGRADLALRNGNNGSYGGPSYDVYLYSDVRKMFLQNSALTKLASENLGLFRVDREKKELEVFAKSGCCWHQTTRYRVVYGIPYRFYVRTDDAISVPGKMVVTTERRVDGVWKKYVETKALEENN